MDYKDSLWWGRVLGIPHGKSSKGMTMPMKNRNWKQEYKTQIERGEDKDQLERQKARREYDKKGIDRAGKHIDHIKPLREGGKSTKGNTRLRSPRANMSDK